MARSNPLKPQKPARRGAPEPLAKGVIPSPQPVSHTPVLTENERFDGFEIKFPAKPSPEVLALFHGTGELPRDHRWHWHRKCKHWYARRNEVTRAFANASVAGEPIAPIPSTDTY